MTSTRTLCVSSGRFFFFSSRRRHTRLQGDWSSDVCSSDLRAARCVCLPRRCRAGPASATGQYRPSQTPGPVAHRAGRSEERRVGKGVDLGGRRIIKKKKKKTFHLSASDLPSTTTSSINLRK